MHTNKRMMDRMSKLIRNKCAKQTIMYFITCCGITEPSSEHERYLEASECEQSPQILEYISNTQPKNKIMIDEGSDNYTSDYVKESIPKCSFQAKKTGKDGLVLQVHHTLPEGGGKVRSYRFTSSSFDLAGERIAVSDSLGNAFIVDLLSYKFWMLPKLPACNFLTFSRYIPKKQDVLVGSVSGPLQFVNTDTGEITGELTGHKKSPRSASFAEDQPYCLTVCSNSAIIWDLRSNSLLHQLTLRSSVGIKQVKFMPVSNNILGLFEDNSVHIWKLENLECTKQIFPDEWGGPNIKAIGFTRNGRGMVMGGQTATLAVFLIDNWTLQKLITLPENYKGVRHLEFVPQLFDGGANKILAVLTSSCLVLFVDTESSVLLKTVEQLEGCVSRLETSLSGKYLVLVMQTGEVNIYSSSQLVYGGQQQILVSEVKAVAQRRASQKHLQQINKQVTALIDVNRLRPILKEFGEYPETHRSLIWKTILNVPENQGAYVALINKGIHLAFSTLDKLFPLTDRSLSNSVKRLLSCLAYWSPIFIQVKYLPVFVFPFVKLMRHDQFAVFETTASIIVNWCQSWFEYVPYPPLNVLDTVKKLMMTHDSQLVTHFTDCHVTPDLYIWSLLETAFFEVLGWGEWQQLWDHILSNHPAFLLFTVVAFNITCRSSLLYLQHIDDFEHFFHTEVIINMKLLISKSYQLWSSTSSDIHPKHTMKPFTPLVKGSMYQMFTDYPKHLLDHQLEKLSTFYDEQASLETQQIEVNKQKLQVDVEKNQLQQARLKETRLKELEGAYKHALRKEEGHLENQRRKVSADRRDLRKKEAVIRSQALDKTLQDKADKYAQLERLVEQFESKKKTSECQTSSGWSSSYQSSNPSSLRLQHASVVHHMSKLKKLCRQTNIAHPQLRSCISKFEDLLGRIESALEREQCSKQLRPCHTEKISELEEETRVLEDEAQHLLRKLSESVETRHRCQLSHGDPSCSKGSRINCYCHGDSKQS